VEIPLLSWLDFDEIILYLLFWLQMQCPQFDPMCWPLLFTLVEHQGFPAGSSTDVHSW